VKRFVVLLCAALLGCSHSSVDTKAEIKAREEAGRATAIDAGADRMLKVASRSDVMFELGFSMISYDPPDDFHHHAFRYMGKNGHVRLKPHGDAKMHLYIGGWVNEKVIRAKPVVSVYLDGMLVETTGAIEGGHWRIDKVLTPDWFRGREWVDLDILCNAIGWHWSDPPDLKVVVLYDFVWSEVP
jgi:hypothetical protein